MAKSLVIVESPAKAKTIKKYLGADYVVKASVGHVKDLPKSKMGVDIENGFLPQYVAIRGKGKILSELRSTAKEVDHVYLGSDPDREGEAIAWHIAEEIRPVNPNIERVLFHEITKAGVSKALAHTVPLDDHKFESQQARRILDRLVGYEISPLLWSKVKRGLSAGRVQSVAVRLIVDREREIRVFIPQEYWSIDCPVETIRNAPFTLKLASVDGQKAEIPNEQVATELAQQIQRAQLTVGSVTRKERKRRPAPPFITSKLQQEAARKLRFSPKRTMMLAQQLYEGIELGKEGAVGLITYMRTDSTRLSAEAVESVREFINTKYGRDYVPEQPIAYKSRKEAQDAHEAIRPTDLQYTPQHVFDLLVDPLRKKKSPKTKDAEDQLRLYSLIWDRFVACQMTPAVYDQTTVDVTAGRCGLRATGQILKFDGFQAVYQESEEDGEKREDDMRLPEVNEGESLKLIDVQPEQHFTQPPPRFSEASLIKELEERGIGRPSTYASILSTIQDREYVERKEGRLYPTELGELVNDLLCDSFPDIVSAEFTATMEEGLDQVEDGKANWVTLLGDFYRGFSSSVEKAKSNMRDVKREEVPTDIACEKCGSTMVIKWGRNGKFLACSGYPECKNTKEFRTAGDGKVEVVEAQTTDEKCENCGAPMAVKRGRFGEFLACTRYPECKTTKPMSVGVGCPMDGCGGFVTAKRSKRGKVFYGCSNYAKTQCGFVSWDQPVAQPCPSCGAKYLLVKETRQGKQQYCHNKDCGYRQSDASRDEEPGGAAIGTSS